MGLKVEIDNRNSELAVYEAERPRMVRDNWPAADIAAWDAWGASVRVRKDALVAEMAGDVPQPEPDLPTAVITPVEDSAAYGVINIGAEEEDV
jgi:hypothetical protein